MPARASAQIRETDLYQPVCEYLTDQGYTVRGEVKKCDIAATKDDELVVVELKLRLSGTALAQAAQRQEIANAVYIAIQRPRAVRQWRRRAAPLLYLVRRLELGLLLVSPRGRKGRRVTVEQPLRLFDRVKKGNLRRAVMREVEGRSGDFNEGGSVGRKLVSLHRETAVHIACCLERFGSLSVRELQELGTGRSTRSVLTNSKQIEGWFGQVAEDTYILKAAGRAALKQYAPVAEHFRELLDQAKQTSAARPPAGGSG